MSNRAAPTAAESEAAPRLHFALTVQPGTQHQAWRAWLLPAGGTERTFASPIELLRHLAQLGPLQPPPGTLK